MSQLPVNNDYDRENGFFSNTANNTFDDISKFYSYRQPESYAEPMVPTPQRQYPTVEPHFDDGVNYSSSLFSDSIFQVYDGTADDPVQMSHSYDLTHFSDNNQPFEKCQTDYTVYELSTPGGFSSSVLHHMDQTTEVSSCADASLSISQPRNPSFVNYADCNMNYTLHQAPLDSFHQMDVNYTCSSMQATLPTCSYTNVYNSTLPGARYVHEPQVANQPRVYQNVENFLQQNQQSYFYSQQYSSNQLAAPITYTQPNCYVNQQSASLYCYPETQEAYQEFQPGIHQQNRDSHYTGDLVDSAQPIWPEPYCANQQPCWSSPTTNNYLNYKGSCNQAQVYTSNHSYPQQQQQQPQPFIFSENYPPNVQNNPQVLQPISKPIQATDSATKVPDSELPSTGRDNRVEQETEDEDEEETVPSPSQPASPCEPVHEYICSHCSKRFARPSHLEIHFRTHTGERPFRCCICSKSFSQASNLQRHMQSHKTWPQLRSIGGKISSGDLIVRPSRSIMPVAQRVQVISTSTLLNYSLVDSQFECRFCGLKVKGFQKIRSHMTQHKSEKVYQCVVSSCLKTFTELGAYTEHLNVAHDLTDSKWLRCSKCLKQFEKVSDLLGHYTSKMTGVSQCSLRKSSSKVLTKKYLNSSQNGSQTSTRLRCPICRHRRFARYGLLRLHLLDDHAASSVSVSSFKTTRIQSHNKPLIPKPQVQPAISISQDTILAETSGPSQSLGDTTSGGTNLRVSDSNPPPMSFRLTNVHLIVDHRRTTKRTSRQRHDVSPLACPLCGRVFKKKKFFDDHCILCQQKQVETERRQRWRENRRQPDNAAISEAPLPVSQASAITGNLDDVAKRTRRSKGNIQLDQRPIPAS